MTLPNEVSIGQTMSHLKRIAPQGFAIGLHIRFAAPRLMFNAYPKEWVRSYARQGLLMEDPTVRWGMTHEGVLRWEEIESDPARVMSQAAEHGLRHGFSCSLQDDSRSFGGFARMDRPFTDEEIAAATDHLGQLHEMTREMEALSREDRLRLHALSIVVAED